MIACRSGGGVVMVMVVWMIFVILRASAKRHSFCWQVPKSTPSIH